MVGNWRPSREKRKLERILGKALVRELMKTHKFVGPGHLVPRNK